VLTKVSSTLDTEIGPDESLCEAFPSERAFLSQHYSVVTFHGSLRHRPPLDCFGEWGCAREQLGIQAAFFLLALTRAHLALAAALILAIPAGEMRRFAVLLGVFLAFAQRAFCARLIRARAAALMVLRLLVDCALLPSKDAKAAIALSRLLRSCLNC